MAGCFKEGSFQAWYPLHRCFSWLSVYKFRLLGSRVEGFQDLLPSVLEVQLSVVIWSCAT